jgi:hypothetical protein
MCMRVSSGDAVDLMFVVQAARFPDISSGDTCNHASVTWTSNDCTVQSFTPTYVSGVGDVHAIAVIQVAAHYSVATHGCAYIKDGQCLECTDCSIGTGVISATVTIDWVFDLSVIAPTVGAALGAPPTITITNVQPCGGAPGTQPCSLGCNGQADFLYFIGGYKATFTSTLQSNTLTAFQGLPNLHLLSDTLQKGYLQTLSHLVLPTLTFGSSCNTATATWTSNTYAIALPSVKRVVASPTRMALALDVTLQMNFALTSHACTEATGRTCSACQDCASTATVVGTMSLAYVLDLANAPSAAPTITLAAFQPTFNCPGAAAYLWSSFQTVFQALLPKNALLALNPLATAHVLTSLIDAEVATLTGYTLPSASFGDPCNKTTLAWTSTAYAIQIPTVRPVLVSPTRITVAFDMSARAAVAVATTTCQGVGRSDATCVPCTAPQTCNAAAPQVFGILSVLLTFDLTTPTPVAPAIVYKGNFQPCTPAPALAATPALASTGNWPACSWGCQGNADFLWYESYQYDVMAQIFNSAQTLFTIMSFNKLMNGPLGYGYGIFPLVNSNQNNGLVVTTRMDTLQTLPGSVMRLHASTQVSTDDGQIYNDTEPDRAALRPPDDLPANPPGTKILHIARVSDAILNALWWFAGTSCERS